MERFVAICEGVVGVTDEDGRGAIDSGGFLRPQLSQDGEGMDQVGVLHPVVVTAANVNTTAATVVAFANCTRMATNPFAFCIRVECYGLAQQHALFLEAL